jgi:formate dehydrogenase subunit gamma
MDDAEIAGTGVAGAEVAVQVCERHGNDPALLIEILHDIQDELDCIPEAVQPGIAKALNIARAEVHGVMSFYHDFRAMPAGRVRVMLCRAEACQAMGATRIIEAFCARQGMALGQTSARGVTVEAVYCLGNCALAPAAMVNGRLHGRVTADRLDDLVREGAA